MNTRGSRRVGLSRNQKTEPLLKSLPSPSGPLESDYKPRKKGAKLKIPDPIKDIFAPPLSSDEEDDEHNLNNQGGALNSDGRSLTLDDIGSSGSEQPPRGSITSTRFKASNKSSRKNGPQFRDEGIDSDSTTSQKRNKAPEVQQQAPNKRQRLTNNSKDKKRGAAFVTIERDSSIPPSSSETQFETSLGFTKKVKAKVTYGKRSTASQESRRSRASEDDAAPKFRRPPTVEYSPQKPRNSKLIVPEGKEFLSPIKDKKPKRLNTTFHDEVDSDDESAPSPTSKSALKASNSATELMETAHRPKSKPGALPTAKTARPKRKPKIKELPSSPPAPRRLKIPELSVFRPSERLEADLEDDERQTEDSNAEPNQDGDEEASEADKINPNETSCPWCGAIVEKMLLQDFSKGKRLNVRMQTKFCEAHRKRTALETWESRHYPQVDWEQLEERFKQHRQVLLGIINGDASHYRTVLASKIELGQARSLRKEDNLNPGYYGPRGFNLMCDFLVKEFTNLLKDKAVHDRVIAGRGPAAFIQAVLVPELGVQLIQEDMSVLGEEARQILEESKALGELVHAEN